MKLNGSVDHDFIDARLNALESFINEYKMRTEEEAIAYAHIDAENPIEEIEELDIKSEGNVFTLQNVISMITSSWYAIADKHKHALLNADFDTIADLAGKGFLEPICRMLPDFLKIGFVVAVVPIFEGSRNCITKLNAVGENHLISLLSQLEFEASRGMDAEKYFELFANNRVVVVREDRLEAPEKNIQTTSSEPKAKKPKK